MKTETISETADPKAVATAWALDELTPPEREAFESEREENPELDQLASETKDFCKHLAAALGQPTMELQHAARSRILFEAARPRRSAEVMRRKWIRRVTLAAACLAVGGGGTYWWMDSTNPAETRYARQPNTAEKLTGTNGSAFGVLNGVRYNGQAAAQGATALPAMAADIQKQEAAVEDARLAMVNVMKGNIVDFVPTGAGNNSTNASTPANNQKQNEYFMAKERYESQLLALNRIQEHSMKSHVDEGGIPSGEKGDSLKAASDETRREMFNVDNLTLAEVTRTANVPAIPARVERGIAIGLGGGYGTGRGVGVGSGWAGVSGERARAFLPATLNTARDDRYISASIAAGDRSDVIPADTQITPGSESYKLTPENPFRAVQREPLSTFSIDVDTASYSNVRRFLNLGQCPPAEAVRLEELVNYFPYDYAPPKDGKPFAVHVEMTATPWNAHHRLARIALKGKEIAQGERPAANLVFLVDVSGSMQPENKLPLVKQSLRFVVERLTEKDTVSMVTYAGESGVALRATSGADKARIMAAIDCLSAGGSTNGAGGIQTAYAEAARHFNKEGINRVILATDGDFNVGVTSDDELNKLIAEKAKSGVFLSVLGYGMGNTKDDRMELLADKGNGNYAYIDSISEARKSLADQFNGTLVTIAKDVKIQIEFNPLQVRSYRLLGYENRMLAKEDFNNDKKDAGEIGAGHTVTALYELIPASSPEEQVTTIEKLKYQPQPQTIASAEPPVAPGIIASDEIMTVKLRWKAPDADQSQLMEVPVKDTGAKLADASPETRWAVAVAGFASLLRDSQHAGLKWEDIRALAKGSKGPDANGYRGEFLQLLNKAESLKGR